MANLIETATYDAAVPQLETNTKAIGGPGGVMNAQAQALANRTKFLKDVLDSPTELANRLPDATTSAKGKVQLASITPAALGTAAEGSATTAAKADHVHQMPTLDDVGEGTTYKKVLAAKADALNAGDVSAYVPDASESTPGKVQLATSAELESGTDASKVLTPAVVRPAVIKRTKMPDGATAVYSQDAWATTDGWVMYDPSYGTIVADPANSVLRYTVAGLGSNASHVLKYFGPSIYNKIVVLRYRTNNNNATMVIGGYSTPYYATFRGSTEWTTVAAKICVDEAYSGNTNYIGFGFWNGTQSEGDWIEIDWIWIGDSLALNGTLSEDGASFANYVAAIPAASNAYASGTITSNGTNVSNSNTVIIHGKVYTFKTALTPTEGEVLIGATAQESLTNLAMAINRTDPGTNDGVKYKIAAAHPLVSASANSLTLTVTALQTGELGNQIILAKEAATLTLSGSTLTGGYSATAKKLATLAAPIIAGNGTRPAAALIELTDTTKIGYEHAVDVASGGTVTLPSGGTWLWFVYGYGATINSAKQGSSAGGTTLTVSGANATVWYRRYA